MNDLLEGEFETAGDMAEALRGGRVSAAELVERALRRAEAWQPETNAFTQLWAEESLSEARSVRADDERPLAGVPVAVKDLFDVAGRETTGCSRAYSGTLARVDAAMVRRLRSAGLVIIGKTNQHELAAGGTNLVSSAGRTCNPWDPRRITGGSSGGSAAAVAAGVVPWALGSDTGGSIRIPSAFCGIVGMKPTTGVLSTEGMMPLAPSMDCPGPMATTTEDVATLLSVLRERDGVGGEAALRAAPRIGVLRGYFADMVHPEALAAADEAAQTLRSGGATVEEVDGRGIADARGVWFTVCCAEFAEAHRGLGRDRARVSPSVRAWMEAGDAASVVEREAAIRRRGEIGGWFRERLAPLAALLVPTTAYAATLADRGDVDLGPWGTVSMERVGPGRLTCPVNLAGLPALSLPAGRSAEDLPLGASLIGREGGEATLIDLGLRWEAAAGYRARRPARTG